MTESITLVAASGCEPVRDTIDVWTRRGLARRSVWIDRDVLALEGNVMSTPVTLVTDKGLSEVPLRKVLADTKYDVVRVLALHQVVEDTPGDLGRLLGDFADRLYERLDETTALVRINLVVPNGELVNAKGFLEPGCDVNVVVSPEDRPREGAVDHGVDRPELFDGHSALACATAGALWLHCDIGPFDRSSESRTGRLGQIVVARSTARVADGRNLPSQVVTLLLNEGVSSLDRYRPAPDTHTASDAALVDAAFRAFLPIGEKELFYQEKRPDYEEQPRKVLRKTLGMLWRIWLQVTKLKVMEWQDAIPKLARAAEEWLERVTLGEFVERLTPEELVEQAETAPIMTTDPLVPLAAPGYHHLWQPLRRLCFGLVDGGPPPPEVAADWGRLTPTVSHARWVAASPDEKFELEPAERSVLKAYGLPSHDIRPGDSSAALRLQTRLTMAAAKIEPRSNPTDTKSDDDQRVIAACRSRIDEWRQRGDWDRSLFGLLVKHIDDQMQKATGALRRRAEEYKWQQQERDRIHSELTKVRDRLWKHATGILASLAVLGACLLLLGYNVPIPVLVRTVGVLAPVAGIVFAVWFVVLFAVAGRMTAYEEQLAQIEADRKNTVAAVREWPTEAQRLGTVYDILLDWGEIIGFMLHEPVRTQPDPGYVTADSERRPEAFKIAEARPGERDRDSLAGTVARTVFDAGWLSRLYDVVVDVVIPNRTDGSLPDPLNEPDLAGAPRRVHDPELTDEPDEDERLIQGDDGHRTDRVVMHARELLLTRLHDDSCGKAAWYHLVGRIRAAMLTLPAVRVMSTVQIVGSDDTVPVLDFFRAVVPTPIGDAPCPQLAPTIFSDTGLINGRAAVARVHLWGSLDQFAASSFDVPQREDVHVYPSTVDDGQYHYQFSLIRLDVSDNCEEEDLVFPV